MRWRACERRTPLTPSIYKMCTHFITDMTRGTRASSRVSGMCNDMTTAAAWRVRVHLGCALWSVTLYEHRSRPSHGDGDVAAWAELKDCTRRALRHVMSGTIVRHRTKRSCNAITGLECIKIIVRTSWSAPRTQRVTHGPHRKPHSAPLFRVLRIHGIYPS